MLPRSTQTRSERDGRKGRVDGRVQEIQRLIGRSLRAAVDFEALGERSILIDCDVIVADGGTPNRVHHRRVRRPRAGGRPAS